MLHLSNTRLPILWHLSDTLRSYFSKDRAESLDLWEKVFQKLCVTGLTLSGTGKTYASAFGIRDVIFALPDQNKSDKQERVLCLVHREQIAKQAMETYRKVFGTSKHYGLLSGNSKNYDAEFLFSTMQMMAKPEVMERFERDAFCCIILDEAHKTGANSYQRIMDYFIPNLWLGMTASPERMDDFDVFGLFDYNIAYEIRLQQAMEENLLCPFHYFGITELEIEGEVFDDETGVRNFRYLICDDRVDYVIRQAKYYGYSGNRVKGLIFCSRKREAKALSDKFNQRGYRTVFLGGDTSPEHREDCMDRLTSDTREDYLDYVSQWISSMKVWICLRSIRLSCSALRRARLSLFSSSDVGCVKQMNRNMW